MNAPLPLDVALQAETGLALAGQGLAFAYGSRPPIFEGVSLAVHHREIVCLLGGSGCGKSTLLRTMAGLAPPTRGSVAFLGQPLTRPHPRAALVFQHASLLPWLNVARNVGFGLNFKHQPQIDRDTRDERIAQALAGVGLADKAHLYPLQLSGGMAQRVALARAMARQPQMLLADEPFSALDAISRAEMQSLLVDLVHRWHTAVLLVTHDIDEAILVADRILLMGAPGGGPGRIVREWVVDIERPRHDHVAAAAALRLEIVGALQRLLTVIA
ncbi:MAG TPA: ABC transporter ATP-binding protein [Luteimonas sp.]|nr:ABC transporter ATP-binding protein [Luteimonas sp.]